MSLDRHIAWAVASTYLGRITQILSSLVLIPVLFRHMPQEELGIWFIISQSAMFVGLLDFGFGPTLTRRIAFAKGLSSSDPNTPLSDESKSEISALVGTGRILYRWLALAVVVVAGLTGAFFLNSIDFEVVDRSHVLFAWGLLIISYAINTWAGFWNCLLSGMGYVASVGFIGTGFQFASAIANIAIVLLGGGLLELAAAQCLFNLLSRQVTLIYIRRNRPEVRDLRGTWNTGLFRSVVKPSLLCWVTSLGSFLILRTDQYFIAWFKGAAELPAYQAAYSFFSNLNILAMAFSGATVIFYSQLWRSGEKNRLHALLTRNLNVAMAIMLTGGVTVIFASPGLFDLWLGTGHFIGTSVLIVFFIMLALEAQHAVFAQATRATEHEIFAPLAIASGLLNLILTWLLIRPLGLLGVALGTMIAQMLTNNWFCIYAAHKRLGLSFRQYVGKSVTPLITLLFICSLCSSGIIRITPESPPVIRLILLTSCNGLLLLVFLFHFALLSEERDKLRRRLRLLP